MIGHRRVLVSFTAGLASLIGSTLLAWATEGSERFYFDGSVITN